MKVKKTTTALIISPPPNIVPQCGCPLGPRFSRECNFTLYGLDTVIQHPISKFEYSTHSVPMSRPWWEVKLSCLPAIHIIQLHPGSTIQTSLSAALSPNSYTFFQCVLRLYLFKRGRDGPPSFPAKMRPCHNSLISQQDGVKANMRPPKSFHIRQRARPIE